MSVLFKDVKDNHTISVFVNRENYIQIGIYNNNIVSSIIHLDTSTAISFRKALSLNIGKARNQVTDLNQLKELKQRFINLGFSEKSFNNISNLQLNKLESFINQVEKEVNNG